MRGSHPVLEDPLSGVELGRSWEPHVLSVVQVSDGETQDDRHQSGASGCSGGGGEKNVQFGPQQGLRLPGALTVEHQEWT